MNKLVVLMVVLAIVLGFSTASNAFFINFESGLGQDGQQIIDIPGIIFTITGKYDWIYGDSTTNNYNTKSIDLGTVWNFDSYQHYGNVFAWLGSEGPAGSGKIDFINNDGTWFQTGYACPHDLYLEGYDLNGNMIASISGSSNLYGNDMGWLRIDAPANQFFDYVILHDTGNCFIVDNMSGDSSVSPIPEPISMILLGSIVTGLLGTGRIIRKNVR